MKTIAFVIPWYGENISGGAESACRDIVKHLLKNGTQVEILTTCVKDFNSDWSVNHHKKGTEVINGLTVRRFKVRKRDTNAFDAVNYKLINKMKLTLEEEQCFFQEMVNSPELYDYIREHKDEYHAFAFMPYMFGTTYYGVKACPEKSILIPCLHEESYAYMTPMKEMFELAQGMIFLAEAEKELAERIYNIKDKKKTVIGTGVNTNIVYKPEEFINKYNMKNPFILYAGRKDVGKNVDTLLKYYEKFMELNKDANIDLVLIGGGSIDIPHSIKARVHDLGFVSIEDKYNGYGAASLLCQPSLHESFSIVIMESWVCEVPVLVHAGCEVTKRFCQVSNGGLYFNNYPEFQECVNFVLNNKETSKKLGKQGKVFVEDNFNWDIVTNRYKEFITNIYL